MNPAIDADAYNRASRLFLQAVDLPPDERTGFLDQACGDDAALRARVEDLLAHDAEGEVVVDEPAVRRFAASLFDAPVAGQTVGHYRVLGKVAQGGMAVVHRAHDPALDRVVALKFLSPELLHSVEARERFLREARAAAAIDHPNVCPVYEVHAEHEPPFIAMAFLEGRTVAERLLSGPMPVDEALSVAIQACHGLEAAHARGVIHRDIKPSNLMLVRPVTGTGREIAKILDFGIASYDPEHTLTQSGAPLGTISYMSPEQVASEPLDERTDLWSLGVTLYEMLAGRRAFQCDTLRGLPAAIAGAQPPALESLRDDIPAGLLQVVSRLLQKDPDDRYATAAEAAVALEQVALGDRTPEASSPARVRATAAAAAAGVALLASSAIAYFTWGNGDTGSTARRELLTPQALTSYPGNEGDPALSPDGTALAFTWTGPDGRKSDIYVQRIGTYEPVQLTNQPDDDESPTWSPDGTRIAFLRDSGDYHEVRVVASSGGPEALLTKVAGVVNSPALDWSPTEDLLAVASQEGVIGVRVARPDGPAIRYTLPGEVGRYPRFDPSGARLAFVVDNFDGPDEFRVVPASGDPAAAVRLRHAELLARAPAFQFAWSADGRRLIYPAFNESPFSSVDVATGALDVLPIPNQLARAPHIRGDRLVYYSLVEWSSNVWAVDLAAPAGDGAPEARPLIQSSRRDVSPRFSSDGRSLVFASDRSGFREIWSCDRDCTTARKLTASNLRPVGSPVWSPSGAEVALDGVLEADDADIYVIDAGGGTPRRLTRSPADDILPSWSADGRWVYFASNTGGEYDVWRISPKGGEPERVTTGGGWETVLTPDGRYMYYVDPTPSYVVRRRDLTTEEEVTFPELGDAGRNRFWYPTEHGIYFRDGVAAPHWIQLLDVETRAIRRICPFGEPEPGPRSLSVSPDGRTLLYVQRDKYNEDIMVVDGVK